MLTKRRSLMVGILAYINLPAIADAAPIRVGRSTSLSGPIQSNALAYNAGSEALFRHVNANGGVNGRKIEIVDKDDAYVPTRCAENTKAFLADPTIVALFQYIGTPTLLAASSELAGSPLVLVGGISGADELKDHLKHPNIFVIRSNSEREVVKMVEHNAAIGIQRFAIFYQDDSFGQGILGTARRVLEARKLKLVGEAPIQRGSLDVQESAKKVIASDAQAVLMFVTAKPAALLVDAVKAQSPRNLQFMTVSTVSADLMTQAVPADRLRGVGIVQVMPSPQATAVGLVAEYQKLMAAHQPSVPLSYPSLEGFYNAKALVELLKRAGPAASRKRVADVLHTFGDISFGGVRMHLSANDRRGASYVELSVIDARGRVIQ
jgi:ABC-type branched-subunit amino acid transport system substrate-binding protein